MLKKLTPIKFTEEAKEKMKSQYDGQELSKAAPKSLDPVHFPVFEIPVNKKVLVYVPNHITVNADGVETLNMDTPLIHAVTDGRRYLYYRCIQGLVNEEAGLNGECPLCESTSEPWELANYIIAEKCRAQGLDPEDTENKSVKEIRRNAFSDRVVKEANRYYTFPIVVIATVNDDGKTILRDEKGNMSCTPMWYSISETQYQDKWGKALEAMEDEPTHPGGNFFMLNFTYQVKSGEANKRDSARALNVSAKRVADAEAVKKVLDDLTKEWTPDKARETVCNNVTYSYDDLTYVADEVLAKTRSLIELYSSKALVTQPAIAGQGTKMTVPEDVSDGFNLESVGETDIDE